MRGRFLPVLQVALLLAGLALNISNHVPDALQVTLSTLAALRACVAVINGGWTRLHRTERALSLLEVLA